VLRQSLFRQGGTRGCIREGRAIPKTFATYKDALDYLFNFTDYERMHKVKKATSVFGLARMNKILEHCGNPHEKLHAVHIAGTKGKGSTAAMLASILQTSGRVAGLYTSPHLLDIRERIQINGEWICEETVTRLLAQLHRYLESATRDGDIYAPTFFEIFTTIALLHFVERGVDFAIFEVGLGGRLDATNVLTPDACAITPVSFDHTDKLGNTLAEIAGEKAGIVKEGVPVVSGVQRPEALAVIRARAAELDAPLRIVGEDIEVREGPSGAFSVRTWRRELNGLRLPLLGRHQRENAATAAGLAELLCEGGLELSDESVRDGLASLRWPGRIQLVARDPDVIIDGAHNVASVEALLETLDALPPKKTTFVIGIARDKDVHSILSLLAPRGEAFVVTRTSNPRAADPANLMAGLEGLGAKAVHVADTPAAALELALGQASPSDRICVTGSMYLAGDALSRLVSD